MLLYVFFYTYFKLFQVQLWMLPFKECHDIVVAEGKPKIVLLAHLVLQTIDLGVSSKLNACSLLFLFNLLPFDDKEVSGVGCLRTLLRLEGSTSPRGI